MADSSDVRSIRQSVRLGDARDIFLSTIVSPNTRRAYRTALTALVDGFGADSDVGLLDPDRVDGWVRPGTRHPSSMKLRFQGFR